ncbi:MAG: alpha/beta fold hydrolase [Steroidobacteraceae bacterium]
MNSAPPESATAVVYVHGLWLSGHEAFMLRRRLQTERHYQWHNFAYRTVHIALDQIADALNDSIAALSAPTVHLIGHSLGGLVILRCLQRHPRQPPGRVVFLGTPAVASRAANGVARFRVGRALLGQAAVEGLLYGHERRWAHAHELGIIAGSQPLGLGRAVAEFTEPNDGVVAVTETRLPGATLHRLLPVSHTGMLLSARVAHEVGNFLEQGRFDAG